MKKDIAHWNFSKYNEDTPDLTDFAYNSSWLLPQLMAFIGTEWPLKRNEEGLISFKDSLLALGSALKEESILFSNSQPLTKAAANGILRVLTSNPRGGLLPKTTKQTGTDGIRWSAGVPLILSAFKQYRSINYDMWDWSEEYRKFFLDKDIYEASFFFKKPLGPQLVEWTTDDYLAFRKEGSTIKSGDKAGSIKAPEKVTTLSGITDPDFKVLPRLVKLMTTQCWVYHPSLRHEYMICDPMNLDNMPEPLVNSDIFVPAPKEAVVNGFPWDII